MKIETIGELLYWSYANLAMAHAALTDSAAKYSRKHFIIRSRLWSGLRKGTMKPRPFADEERLKLIIPRTCCYCGTEGPLSIDHVFPRSRDGSDSGDNIVMACRSCNSSKGAKDMLEWMAEQGQFPPLLLLRRYLKLAIEHAIEMDFMDVRLTAPPRYLPFTFAAVPEQFPPPSELRLWVVPLLSKG